MPESTNEQKSLNITRRNLMGWLHKGREYAVPDEQKLNVIMMSLADMCDALGGRVARQEEEMAMEAEEADEGYSQT